MLIKTFPIIGLVCMRQRMSEVENNFALIKQATAACSSHRNADTPNSIEAISMQSKADAFHWESNIYTLYCVVVVFLSLFCVYTCRIGSVPQLMSSSWRETYYQNCDSIYDQNILFQWNFGHRTFYSFHISQILISNMPCIHTIVAGLKCSMLIDIVKPTNIVSQIRIVSE